jgi:hypothetical protein
MRDTLVWRIGWRLFRQHTLEVMSQIGCVLLSDLPDDLQIHLIVSMDTAVPHSRNILMVCSP